MENITETHQMVWNSNQALSAADISALEANPNLIMDIWFNNAILPSGYAKDNIENFWPCNDYTGSSIGDISDSPTVVDLGSGSRLKGQNIGLSNLLLRQDASQHTLGTAVTQTFDFKGFGDYVDTGIIVNNNTNFSMAIAFELSDSYNVDRYIVSSSTGTNKIQVKQVDVDQVTIQIGQWLSPNITLMNSGYHSIVGSYNASNDTIQYAVNGDTLTIPEAMTFTFPIDTSILIGVDVGKETASSFNSNIGIGYFKTEITTEQEWQDFWTSVQTIYP